MAEIPVFKDRRMSGVDPKTGLLSSYLISSSYAGILRLSPNSSATLLDLNENITITEEIEDYFYYNDDPTLALTDQFVTVSTSDGILLDMSIKETGIHFNKLYVQGALKTPGVIAYISKGSKFYIDKIAMPMDGLTLEGTAQDGPSDYYIEDDAISGEALSDKLLNYYILINKGKDDSETRFEYENIRNIINRFAKEALSELTALPTGSIHWIPVNLEEYTALLRQDGNEHNSSNLRANTLIRDFLLCDGSLYKNKDFPELAKILNKESVVFWDYDPDTKTMNPPAKPHINNNNNHTFRVPDLRSMFIKYIVPSPSKIDTADDYMFNNGKGIQNKNGNWDLGISNKTGSWEMDSSKNQEIIIKKKLDKHYHFIVFDNNSAKQHNTKSFVNGTITFTNAIGAADKWGWDTYNNAASPLAKYGSSRRKSDTLAVGDNGSNQGTKSGRYSDYLERTKGCRTTPCAKGYWSCHEDQGPVSYIYAPLLGASQKGFGLARTPRALCHGLGFTCGYILSVPTSDIYKTAKTVPLDNYIGQSSWSLAREVEYEKVNWEKYNPISKKFYSVPTEHINTAADRYQIENCPEFYACLPLIKI